MKIPEITLKSFFEKWNGHFDSRYNFMNVYRSKKISIAIVIDRLQEPEWLFKYGTTGFYVVYLLINDVSAYPRLEARLGKDQENGIAYVAGFVTPTEAKNYAKNLKTRIRAEFPIPK